MSPAPRVHRFRPRYRGVAWIAIGAGLLLGAIGAATAQGIWLGGAAIGIALGALYLGSPAWRLAVRVDDAALEVTAGKARRFRLAWGDVIRVVASPSTHSCFVDGGTPAHSLLVPGDGAPAPYDVEDRAGLYAAIVAHVPADRLVEVETLEGAC